MGDTPLATPIVKVLRALHRPDLRRDVWNDSKLPHVQQDTNLPPDQEMGNAPLVPPVAKEIRVPRNPKLSVVPQDLKLPPSQELGNALLAPRDVRTSRVPRDLKMLVVLQDPKLPPDWAWCRAPLSPPDIEPADQSGPERR